MRGCQKGFGVEVGAGKKRGELAESNGILIGKGLKGGAAAVQLCCGDKWIRKEKGQRKLWAVYGWAA